MLRRSVHYAGTVQGVGFRYTTRSIASRYAVTGYVKNLPDGRVELVAEGDADELDRFLQSIRDAMPRYIADESVVEGDATGQFPSFTIAF